MKAIKYHFSFLFLWMCGLGLMAQNTPPKFIVDYNGADSTTTFQSGVNFVRNGDRDQYSLSSGEQFQDQFDLSKVKSISRYYVQPIKHVYDETTESEAVVEKVKEDGTVVLGSGTKELPKVGEIIVSAEAPGAPDGFLYRVEEVKNENGVVELKTSPAYLNELFDEVNVRIPLHNEIESFARADGKVFYPSKKAKEINFIDIDTTYVIRTDTVKNLQSESWLKDFKAELGIKFGLSLDGTFVMEKKTGKWAFDRLGFELEGKLSADVNVKLSLKKKLSLKPIYLGELRLRKVTFTVFGIPVRIRPVVKTYMTVDMDGSVSLTFTPIKFAIDTKYSLMYTDEPDHITGQNLNQTYDPPSWDDLKKNFTVKGMLANLLDAGIPDFSMKGQLKVGFKPKFVAEFYGREDIALAFSFIPYVKVDGELTVKHTLDFGDEDYDLGGNFTVTDGVDLNWGIDLEGEARLPFRIPYTEARKDNIYPLPTINLLERHLWSIASLFPSYHDFWLSPEKNAKEQPSVHFVVEKEKPTWVLFDEDDFGFCYRTKGSTDWTYISMKDKYANASYGIDQSFSMKYDLPTSQLQNNKTYIVAPYTHIKTSFGGFNILRKGGKFKTGENDSSGGGEIEDVPGQDL